VNAADEMLVTKRGWSVRQPVNEPVVILMSGGIDSSVLAELCIKNLGNILYPLYIKRGAKAELRELEATQKIINYLRNLYPENIKDLKTVSCEVVPKELYDSWGSEEVQIKGLPLRNIMLISLAVQYATSLKETIRTVIIGAEKVLPEGSEYPDMSLLSLVADTIMVCSNTNDWDWQVMSPLMIPGLFPHKDYVTKNDLVLWAQSNNFPLDDTYSCTSGNEECFLCKSCMAKKRIIQ
jgi:hypothetical protein